MCGIFAVSGMSDAANVVLKGLKSLEYRGYDSWGIGVGKELETTFEKHRGKIQANASTLPESSVAFGHTRWATHGGVSEANAHPHSDCSGRIGVVHNGIIENYESLKAQLVKKGHQFSSQTDTEVIAHMVEEELKTHDLPESVSRVFASLKGFSAVVVFDALEGEFVAIRRGSPLVVGITKAQVFLSSDALSLAPYTRKVIFLPDEVLVHIQGTTAKFMDLKGKPVKLASEMLDHNLVPAERGKFAHFMLKEIHDQPRVLSGARAAMDTAVAQLAESLSHSTHLNVFGCGSAYYASLFGSYLLSGLARRRSQVVAANESNFTRSFMGSSDYALFVSQSGETIDVLEALSACQEQGTTTGALVNVIGSSLSRRVKDVVPLSAGPEIGVASTKVFTAMMVAFYLLAARLAGKPETEVKRVITDAVKACAQVMAPAAVKQYLAPLVKRLKNAEHIYVLGKDRLYPMALEAALKLKEVTYIHAEGFASGELKHGMIALVEKGTPVIVFVPEDMTRDDALSACAQVKARGAYVIGIGPVSHPVFDYYLPTGEAGELSALPMVIAIQLLAYHLALARKLDPDKPRNLAKSVTVK